MYTMSVQTKTPAHLSTQAPVGNSNQLRVVTETRPIHNNLDVVESRPRFTGVRMIGEGSLRGSRLMLDAFRDAGSMSPSPRAAWVILYLVRYQK